MILSAEQLLPALQAWAFLSATRLPLRTAFEASTQWLMASWEAGYPGLPLTLVHDLGHLLLLGPQHSVWGGQALAQLDEGERKWRLAYVDCLLLRAARSPSLLEAHNTIAGLAAPMRERAIVYALSCVLPRCLSPLEVLEEGNPACLRTLRAEYLASLPADWMELADRLSRDHRRWALEQLVGWCDLPQGEPSLRPEELWVLEHLEQLPQESSRLALRQLHAARYSLGKIASRQVGRLKRMGEVARAEATDVGQYPAGGFEEISRRGSFENLVRSELAFVGEAQVELGGADLFELRAVEDDLLFYARDESPLLTQRRRCRALVQAPAVLRDKVRSLEYQTLVVVEGLLLALVDDLCTVFGTDGFVLEVVLCPLGDEDQSVVVEELALLSVALEGHLSQQRVTLREGERGQATQATLILSPFPPTRAGSGDAVRELWVRVGAAEWQIGAHRYSMAEAQPRRALLDRILEFLASA